MCQEGFQESRERCIYLPEDDPDSFGAVIEYLYTGNFRIEHDSPTSGFTRESSLIELATIYVAAEKYHLDALKTLVVDEFSLRLVPGKPEDWLASAEVIYQAIPDSDKIFPQQLHSYVVSLLAFEKGHLSVATSMVLNESVGKGGRLAVDINNAVMTYWKERVKTDMQTQRNEHLFWHPKCHRCWISSCDDLPSPDDGPGGTGKDRDGDDRYEACTFCPKDASIMRKWVCFATHSECMDRQSETP